MSGSDEDSFFMHHDVVRAKRPSSPPRDRQRAKKRKSGDSDSSPDPVPVGKPAKRNLSRVDASAPKHRAPAVEDLFADDAESLEIVSRGRKPNKSKGKRKEVDEDRDDLQFSDFSDYMDTERRNKQSKEAALEALKLKRQNALRADEKRPPLMGTCPVCDKKFPLDQLEAHTNAEIEQQIAKKSQPQTIRQTNLPVVTKGGFRPASPSIVAKKPLATKSSNTPTMDSIAAKVAAEISSRFAAKPKPSPSSTAATSKGKAASPALDAALAVEKRAAPSRPWAMAPKEVKAPSKGGAATPKVVEKPRAKPSAHPKASTSKVIDLDDSDEELAAPPGRAFAPRAGEAEDEDDAMDAAFGLDLLSPDSKKAFMAIAGMDDSDGEQGGRRASMLNDDWDDVLEQERAPKKTAKRGKTWNNRGRGSGKPWFRRGAGRGRGRGRARGI